MKTLKIQKSQKIEKSNLNKIKGGLDEKTVNHYGINEEGIK